LTKDELFKQLVDSVSPYIDSEGIKLIEEAYHLLILNMEGKKENLRKTI